MLTDQQIAAVEVFRKGNSFALRAVAGSGKTHTLVQCMQHAIPGTLNLAFNKKNADDLQKKMPNSVTSSTLNALGHRTWRKHITRQVIVQADKLVDLLKNSPFKNELGENFMNVIQLTRLAKTSGIPSGWNTKTPDKKVWLDIADDFDIDNAEELLPYSSWLLQESCRTAFQGLIDYDDQLYMPVIYGSPFTKFNCIAVDEAQDLSPLQHRMVERSLAQNGQIVIVGDPNQAIYAWRGASDSSFFDLVEKFSLPIMPLTVSFRCPRAVVQEARKYVPDIEAASDVEGSVKTTNLEIEPGLNKTVLSRTNAPLIRLAFRGIKSGIAVNYSGKDFLFGIKALFKKCRSIPDLERWRDAEIAKTNKTGKISRIMDKYEAAVALFESGDPLGTLTKMSQTPRERSMGLSTIHKAKGDEWDNVVYLNYEQTDPVGQEANIKYVGVTRAKANLLLKT